MSHFLSESSIQKKVEIFVKKRKPNAVMTKTEEYLPRRVRMISLGDRYSVRYRGKILISILAAWENQR